MMTIAISTTSGFLMLLHWVHLILTFLWMSAICVDFLCTQKSVFSPMYTKLSSSLAVLSGVILMAMTPSSLHSSWGAAVLLGSVMGLLIFLNPFIPGARGSALKAVNFIFIFPVTFFMGMASHMGMQMAPASSLLLLLTIAAAPAVLVEIVFLTIRPQIQRVSMASLCGVLLTAVSYILLELFSK